MSIKKRIPAIAISIIAVISVLMGGVFCSADEVDYGTYEDGIYKEGKQYWFQTYPAYTKGDGLANGDFQQGLKFWAQNFGKKCSDIVTLNKEGDNTYITFDGSKPSANWDGINSVVTKIDGVAEGDVLAVLYKWRGENENFQIYLTQWELDEKGVGHNENRQSSSMNAAKRIYEAVEEGEWNITVTGKNDATKPGLLKPTLADGGYYLSVGIQVTTDPTVVFDIDDVQIVRRNTSTGMVYDLSGKLLYDLNNLEVKVVEESEIDLSDFKMDSKKVKMPGPSGISASDAVIKAIQSEEKVAVIVNPASPWFWVVVSAGLVIIIAAAVVVILLIKKKKSSDDTVDEMLENADEEVPEDFSEETE